MADFKAHTSVGVIWGVAWGVFSFFSGLCSVVGGFVVFFLAAASSAAPDVDSNIGKPRELVLSFLGIAIPILLFLKIFSNTSTENILAITLASFFVTRFLFGYILAKITVHRGLWHSIPAAICSAGTTYLIFFDLPVRTRIAYAVAVLGGFISHLILDEIYSVKFLEVSTMFSLGSALKFSGPSKIQTILLYIITFFVLTCCFSK